MKNIIKASIITLMLTTGISWAIITPSAKNTESNEQPHVGKSIEAPKESIVASERMVRKNGNVFLEIIFKIPVTCQDAAGMLDPNSLEIEVVGKRYTLRCGQINDHTIVLFYLGKEANDSPDKSSAQKGKMI